MLFIHGYKLLINYILEGAVVKKNGIFRGDALGSGFELLPGRSVISAKVKWRLLVGAEKQVALLLQTLSAAISN